MYLCVCVGPNRQPSAKMSAPIEMPLRGQTAWVQGTRLLSGLHMGATCQMLLNDPCSAVMWAVVSVILLLLQLVILTLCVLGTFSQLF